MMSCQKVQSNGKPMNWRQWAGWVFGLFVLGVVGFYLIQPLWPDGNTALRLVIYTFSTQEEVLTQDLIPAFQQNWQAQHGEQLEIEVLFGAAETMASQINLGAPADLVIFSNQQQINWLKLGKSIPADAGSVIIGSTPLVIVTRPGNPAGVQSFEDLGQMDPDLVLIHPDPNSSGGGQWALLAEYGSAALHGTDPQAAQAQLRAIWQHVRLMAPSARSALTLFELGAGDFLITYEQDALLAQARGVPLEIVIPESTILAQPVAVLVEANLTRAERTAAQAFLDFLISPEGQQMQENYYLRQPDGRSTLLPALQHSFTAEDLGGWQQAYDAIIAGFWQSEIAPQLDLEPVAPLLAPGDD